MVSDDTEGNIFLVVLLVSAVSQSAHLVHQSAVCIYVEKGCNILADNSQSLKSHTSIDVLLDQIGVIAVSVIVGFKSEVVTYERHERLAGESHYPLSKMLALAFDGITSLSNKPIRLITGSGIFVSLISFIGVIWAIVCAAMGSSVAGWASIVCIVCFMSGVQLVCLGVIGEYIGKIYMETKARPRYIISERTWAPYERKYHG